MAEEPIKRTESLPARNDHTNYTFVSGYYTPEPFQTYHIPKHNAFNDTGRRISHAFNSFGHAIVHPYGDDYPLRNPKADIRESKTTYYIDLEIPGLESKDHVTLKWINPSTLFVEAVTTRPGVPETEGKKEGDDTISKKDVVAFVVNERKIGTWARAFQFPIHVDQDNTKAKLGFGVIRITVPKYLGSEQVETKTVEVEHDGQ